MVNPKSTEANEIEEKLGREKHQASQQIANKKH